ncbi:MAG: cheW [Gemmatimonadetes bacterium]|nr:cheW [Gemmatimonadota bacterium]
MPLSESTLPVLLARIDDTQIGFSATAVREIVRAVAIAPLAGAPGVIEGAINLHGQIVPVVDVRQRLALPAVPVAPGQFLVLLETSDRLIAVRVDDVEDVTVIPASSLESPAAVSLVLQRLQGIAAIESGALVIYDVDAFLSQAEREQLDRPETVPG